MIPRISKGGASFGDAAQYYAHDKAIGEDGKSRGLAQTSDRVEWVESVNLPIDPTLGTHAEQIEAMKKCATIQQWTADHQKDIKLAAGGSSAGRKLEKPVYTYSLAWSPDETVDREEMMRAAHSSLKALGMEKCQTLIVAHNDTHMQHVHCIVNRVDPDHGRAVPTSCDHLKLSKWAEAYELERGKILVPARAANNAMRDKDRDQSAQYNRDAAGHGKIIKSENLTRDEARIVARYDGIIRAEIARGVRDDELGKSIRETRETQQNADRAMLTERHRKRTGRIERDLEIAYGHRRKSLTDEIQATQERIGCKGWFRRAIRRVTGHQQRDQANVKHLMKSLANLDLRMDEKRNEMIANMKREKGRLYYRHKAERARDERLIALARSKTRDEAEAKAPKKRKAPAEQAAQTTDEAKPAKTKGRGTRGQNRTEGRTRDRSAERKAARIAKLKGDIQRGNRSRGRDRDR